MADEALIQRPRYNFRSNAAFCCDFCRSELQLDAFPAGIRSFCKFRRAALLPERWQTPMPNGDRQRLG
jgi:hypothetical protein